VLPGAQELRADSGAAAQQFAEAVNRLDISQEKAGLPDLVGPGAGKLVESVAKRKTKGALEAAGQKLSGLVEDLQGEERPRRGR
jgi:hypothetical protein